MQAPEPPHRLDMRRLPPQSAIAYDRLLADNLRGFLSELCLVNAGVVIAYICAKLDGNIDDLVSSSAELFLRPGLLHYARSATIHTDWGRPPNVVIDMEFRHDRLIAAFKVVFDDAAIGVHIEHIDFPAVFGTPEENLRCFGATLAAARLAGN